MKFKSLLLSEASGALGGLVFSHNKGGAYVRARTTPTNPNSAAQIRARTSFQTCATCWSNVLTSAQRAAWNAYAETITRVNPIGTAVRSSGIAEFVASNTLLTLSGESTVLVPPAGVQPSLEIYGGQTASYSIGGPELTFETGSGSTVTGCTLVVFASAARPAGNLSTKVPFRFMGTAPAAAGTIGVSFDSPFPLVIGSRFQVRVRSVRTDGSYSPFSYLPGIAVA